MLVAKEITAAFMAKTFKDSIFALFHGILNFMVELFRVVEKGREQFPYTWTRQRTFEVRTNSSS
jgi:hypothetical protein